MDDLISRRDVLVELKGLYIAQPQITNDIVWDSALDSATDKIKDLPSVDAVEVVRCRDCKHWNRYTLQHNGNDFRDWNEAECEVLASRDGYNEINRYVEEDDFCSYGERKTDG